MTEHETNLEPRVARIEGEVSQVAASVEKMATAVERLSDRIDRKTAPNFGNLIALGGLILAIAAPCGYYVQSQIERLAAESVKLDERLQRETHLINDHTVERINSLDKLSIMRHDETVTLTARNLARIERLEDWNREQVRADLEELRKRRMGSHNE